MLGPALPAALLASAPVQLPPITIAPGVQMPMVSIGHPDSIPSGPCVHGRGKGCAAAMGNMTLEWLRLGGRGIDTAYDYGNQEAIGAALRTAVAGGIIASANQTFITTKVSPGACTAEAALAAVRRDLQQLGLPRVDLIMHHFPCDRLEGTVAVWRGLVQARELGLARAIGVSHYGAKELDAVAAVGKGLPAVNQCAMQVGGHDDATIAYCKAKGIVYEAFSALRGLLTLHPRFPPARNRAPGEPQATPFRFPRITSGASTDSSATMIQVFALRAIACFLKYSG